MADREGTGKISVKNMMDLFVNGGEASQKFGSIITEIAEPLVNLIQRPSLANNRQGSMKERIAEVYSKENDQRMDQVLGTLLVNDFTNFSTNLRAGMVTTDPLLAVDEKMTIKAINSSVGKWTNQGIDASAIRRLTDGARVDGQISGKILLEKVAKSSRMKLEAIKKQELRSE